MARSTVDFFPGGFTCGEISRLSQTRTEYHHNAAEGKL
jgi:hypothetical protein